MPTRDEADYLVAAVMMLPDIRDSAINSLGGLPLFDSLLFPSHAMIWEAVVKIHPLCGRAAMSGVALSCEVKSANTSPNDGEAVGEAVELLREISEDLNDMKMEPRFAERMLEGFVVAAKKRSFIEKLNNVGDLADLSEFTNQTTKEVARISYTGEADIEHPLDDPDEFMPERILQPTGIDWIDFLSGGGHAKGEVVGILGPQSGGKTLTATDMLISRAKMESHSLLVTYEQNVRGDVSTRLYTRLFDDEHGDLLRDYKNPLAPDLEGARVDVNFFRRYRRSQWPKAVEERYQYLSGKYSKYIHTMDFSKKIQLEDPRPQGLRGVADIETALLSMDKAGTPAEFLIVDWLWPAATRWFYYSNNRKLTKELDAAIQFLYDLKQLTQDRMITTFVNHQLDTEHTRSSPATQPNVTNAWNIKSFSMFMDHCYVIGNRDKETHVMWLGNDKARTGIPQYILGQMDGAMGVISKTDGYELSRGRFVEKGSGDSPDGDEDSQSPASRYTL